MIYHIVMLLPILNIGQAITTVQANMMLNYSVNHNLVTSGLDLGQERFFGPDDQTLIPRLKRLISKNSYKTIGDGSGLIDVTCLSNFVDAVCSAIEAPERSLGKFYNISNGDPRTFNSIMKAYTDKFEGVYRQRKLPYLPIFSRSFG